MAMDWTIVQESMRAAELAPELPVIGDPYTGDRFPDWIMLATRAYISSSSNHTVAHGKTSDGHPIEVSLFAAHPPAVSHLRVHCPGREKEFDHNPAVIFSRDGLILFDVCMERFGIAEYLIYRANPEPSLVSIPDPGPYPSGLGNTGIVPCGANHFMLAALYWDNDLLHLATFSTKTGAWTTRVAPVEPSVSVTQNELNVLGFQPSKVISLEGSLLGWVDMWRGIMVCDVLSAGSKLHYIPMPEPMPGNVKYKGDPAIVRDVIGCGDVIKFVEMDEADDEDRPVFNWIAVTRSRKLDSAEWGVAHEVRSEDLTASEDFDGWSDLLPDEICVDGKPNLKKMPVGLPTLCEFNKVMYLMCKLHSWYSNGWVIAVDTESKKLQSGVRFSAVSTVGFMTAYYPSSFSKYFNENTTGIEGDHPISDVIDSLSLC